VSDRELRNLSLELRNLSSELRNVSSELRNVSSELRNVSLELRNVSSELRNVSLELRNVSLEGLSYRSKAGSRRPQRGPSAAPQTRHSGGCLLRGARGPAPQTGNRMVKPSPFSIAISILKATEFKTRNR
jgi:hypothetical protein